MAVTYERSCAGCGHEAAGNVSWYPGWRCRFCAEEPADVSMALAEHAAPAIETIAQAGR